MRNPTSHVQGPKQGRSPKAERGWARARSILECGGNPATAGATPPSAPPARQPKRRRRWRSAGARHNLPARSSESHPGAGAVEGALECGGKRAASERNTALGIARTAAQARKSGAKAPHSKTLECGGDPATAGATPLSGRPVRQPKRRRRGGAALPAHSRTWRLALALCFLCPILCLPCSAQYALDWWTVDGGGGTSTGGDYTVTGTIGQPDAGPPAYAGGYAMVGGFGGRRRCNRPVHPRRPSL